MNKAFFIIAILAAIFIVSALLFLFPVRQYLGKNSKQACTFEAKICSDGSTVGRTGPNCEFAPCLLDGGVDIEYLNDESALIRQLFVEKYPRYTNTITASIRQRVGSYVRGSVSFEEGSPSGIFFAVKTNGEWKIVHDGNGQIPCTLENFGFPKEMFSDCAN